MVRRQSVLHLRLDRRRADEPDAFKEEMEVGDVEVDDLPDWARTIVEVHLEAKAGVAKAVLERAPIVGSSFGEAELRESLEELRRGRDVNVEGPGDLTREVPVSVAEGADDREAVLPR